MTKDNLKKLTTIVAAIALAYTPVTLVSPVQAYDDDVEVVCTENDAGETICADVEDLKVECPLSDPDGVGELCGGLEESRPGRGAKHLAMIGIYDRGEEGEDPGRGPSNWR